MANNKKKLRIGWFTFSCSEDSTVLFTELLNDHWQEWVPLLNVRHAKVLQTNNVLDELDVAFIEGAIASKAKEKEVKKIRAKSKKVVAIGACAVTGMPSAQRNEFPLELRGQIDFLLKKFNYGSKVKKLSDVITVDEKVPGCPMNENKFLEVMNKMLKEFDVA